MEQPNIAPPAFSPVQRSPSHSSGHYPGPPPSNYSAADGISLSFDLVSWHPAYQSCQRYFVNHAQHSGLVQAVASFINIRLPFQWTEHPLTSLPEGPSAPVQPVFGSPYPRAPSFAQPGQALPFVSLIPYIRRLVITGFDSEGIMHGFFGSDWMKGVGSFHEIERRNYMFAAKSIPWAGVKTHYEHNADETVPFMTPVQRVQLSEIEKSDKSWSEWLAMEDWMIGPRAPHFMDPPLSAGHASYQQPGDGMPTE